MTITHVKTVWSTELEAGMIFLANGTPHVVTKSFTYALERVVHYHEHGVPGTVDNLKSMHAPLHERFIIVTVS